MALPFRPCGSAGRNISLLPRHVPKSITTQVNRVWYHSSVSTDELTHFSSLASSWWDPLGPSRILHLMNPLRHDFIASCIAESNPLSSHNYETSDILTNSSGANGTASTNTNRGLRYLDIGCGGGIFAESLARTIPPLPHIGTSANSNINQNLSPVTQASSILAIDPSPVMIKIATSHARADPLVHSHLQSGRFKYENTTLEALLASNSPSPASTSASASASSSSSSSSSPSLQQPSQPPSTSTSTSTSPSSPHLQFDIITLFEVLEHVNPHTSSPRSFIKQCLQLLQPGGWLIGSTIARTLPSYILNQVIAEAPWPIGVVPRGTHEWDKFVNEDELKRWAGKGLREIDGSSDGGDGTGMRWKCVGAIYFPGLGWKLIPGTERLGNYFWAVQRGRAPE
ncbi:hexaprenyldihydroxybenzoate methyltransferase [Paracoccidioides lutzii Pb01]|uniref:Ubiquinone biosynthesis O-methyltransferase, mitochondrial n=1 Tax=Paracoccidioides lutzii (strain ATCC MYA-826 / Pb01) TaxID=502779 RepID=C1H898_PARBA|nr:hexaprenyldihydroxybenzoate methyltransferase [Paracoccidioides lutzii Pb01]EEH36657.1 hexaprenyldihydroxybenzoate methyltransferase [Paracoccidioides lutzii Pb01]